MTIFGPTLAAAWRTPEWEAEYAGVKASNPELAQAMLDMGMSAMPAGMILAGAAAISDTTPWTPGDGVVTY